MMPTSPGFFFKEANLYTEAVKEEFSSIVTLWFKDNSLGLDFFLSFACFGKSAVGGIKSHSFCSHWCGASY